MQLCSKSFKSTHQFHGSSGTDMLDPDICTGFQGEHTVTGDKGFLSNRRRTVDPKKIRSSSVVDSIYFNERRVLLMKTDGEV